MVFHFDEITKIGKEFLLVACERFTLINFFQVSFDFFHLASRSRYFFMHLITALYWKYQLLLYLFAAVVKPRLFTQKCWTFTIKALFYILCNLPGCWRIFFGRAYFFEETIIVDIFCIVKHNNKAVYILSYNKEIYSKYEKRLNQ